MLAATSLELERDVDLADADVEGALMMDLEDVGLGFGDVAAGGVELVAQPGQGADRPVAACP
jgi:hypothetical protein